MQIIAHEAGRLHCATEAPDGEGSSRWRAREERQGGGLEGGEWRMDAVSKREMHTYLRITGSPFWAMVWKGLRMQEGVLDGAMRSQRSGRYTGEGSSWWTRAGILVCVGQRGVTRAARARGRGNE